MKIKRNHRGRALGLACAVTLAATLAALVSLFEGLGAPTGLLDSRVSCEWLEPGTCGPAKG